MKIENQSVYVMTLTEAEYDALQTVEQMLYKLQMGMWANERIVSMDSGECVDASELGRVRGILSALAEHRTWSKQWV